MKEVTIVLPSNFVNDIKKEVVVLLPITNDPEVIDISPVVKTITNVGLPGPQGPQGPGIFSNVTRLTASVNPPENPEVNDLWIDLS